MARFIEGAVQSKCSKFVVIPTNSPIGVKFPVALQPDKFLI
jgi:hypothetical protein